MIAPDSSKMVTEFDRLLDNPNLPPSHHHHQHKTKEHHWYDGVFTLQRFLIFLTIALVVVLTVSLVALNESLDVMKGFREDSDASNAEQIILLEAIAAPPTPLPTIPPAPTAPPTQQPTAIGGTFAPTLSPIAAGASSVEIVGISAAGRADLEDTVLTIKSQQPQGAFGEFLTATLLPIVEMLPKRAITEDIRVASFGTGDATVDADNMYTVSTGVGTIAIAALLAKSPVIYHPGKTMVATFSALFGVPTAGYGQRAGLLTESDSVTVGYNGTEFGVFHSHHGKAEIQELAITVAASSATTATVTVTGAPIPCAVTISTIHENAQEIADCLSAALGDLYFVTATFVTAGLSTVDAVRRLSGPDGAYAFAAGGTGMTASWTQISAGVDIEVDFTARASFNGDTVPWIDPQALNVYWVQFGYLGAANMEYYIKDETGTEWVLMHTVVWGNLNTRPSFNSPTMRLGLFINNEEGGTTDVSIKSGSMAGYVGGPVLQGKIRSAGGILIGVGTTLTPIITLRVAHVLNGEHIVSSVLTDEISAGTDSARGAIVQLIINCDLSGGTVPQFTAVSETDSIVEVDDQATSCVGGSLLVEKRLGAGGSINNDLTNFHVQLIMGDTLTIMGAVTSGAAADVSASIVWEEQT